MGSLQRRIYVASKALSKIGIYLPFVVVVAFIFQHQLLLVLDPLFFHNTEVSHLVILQDQYAFLSQRYKSSIDVGLFHLFELFIWAAAAVGLLRILTGACSRAVLDSSFEKLEKIESMGRSRFMALAFYLALMPLCMLFSLEFQLVSASIQIEAVMTHAPRFFVCLMAFVFCGSMIFFAEGLLMLLSLVFSSPRPLRP
jgi:hypothetical protein